MGCGGSKNDPIGYSQQPIQYAQPAPQYAQPGQYQPQPMMYAPPPQPMYYQQSPRQDNGTRNAVLGKSWEPVLCMIYMK